MTVRQTPRQAVLAGAEAEAGARRRVPGEEGLWVFILGDMIVFALFFGTILVTRADDRAMVADAQEALHPALGILNTVLLLTGSLLVIHALRRLGDGSRKAAVLLALTLLCATGFAAVKVTEYALLVGDGYSGGTNDFFMYYFVFTGIHLAHLVIGAIIVACLLRVALRRHPSEGQLRFAECGAIYWHMVDLLWLVLFPLLYLVR